MQNLTRKAASLFLENHQMVLQTAFRNAPFPGMAEDIAQDVFMEFVNNAGRWDYSRDIVPLLVTITKKVSLRYWREHKKTMPQNLAKIFEMLHEAAEQANDDASADSRLQALRICLEKLQSKSREMIDHFYRDKLGMQKIADHFGMSLNAVRLSVFRIRKQLRACIQNVLNDIP